MIRGFAEELYNGWSSATGRRLYVLPFILALLAILLLVPCIILNDIPQRDVACRYAPMAEAIADGDYLLAFNPRIPLLHPLLGGIVCRLFCCNGFLAVKICSMLCYALTLMPLMFLMRRLYGARVSFISGILYLGTVPLLRFAFSGLRESLKCLLLVVAALIAVKIWECRRDWRLYFIGGIMAFLMCMTRIEMIFCGAFFLLYLARLDVGEGIFPWRSLMAFCVATTGLLPVMFIYRKLNGRLILDSHLISFEKTGALFLFLCLAVLVVYLLCYLWNMIPHQGRRRIVIGGIVLVFLGVLLKGIAAGLFRNPIADFYFLERCIEGMFSFMLPLVVVGVFVRLFTGEWSKEDNIVLIICIVHAASVIVPMVVLEDKILIHRRYLNPGIALALGWSAVGWSAIVDFLKLFCPFKVKRRHLKAFLLAIGIVVTTCFVIYPFNENLISESRREKRNVIRRFARAIRCQEEKDGRPECNRHFDRNLRVAVVIWNEGGWTNSSKHVSVIPYLAGGCISNQWEGEKYLVRMMPLSEEQPAAEGRCLDRVNGKKLIYEVYAK